MGLEERSLSYEPRQLSAEEADLNMAVMGHVMRQHVAEQSYPEPAIIEGSHLSKLPKSLRKKVKAKEIILPGDCDFPIPPIREDGWLQGGWRDVKIKECGEPLVELKPDTGACPKFGTYSAYCNQDHREIITPFETQGSKIQYADHTLYARESVAQSLHDISSYLPPGLKLVVLDAHRHPKVQSALYEVMVQRLITEQGMPEAQARTEAQKYVSKPSINPPSPHTTGAAVDVALFDHTTGGMLDYGTKFDHMGDEAALRFYEQAGLENSEPGLNRRYLYWLMRIGNFKGWPYEWWHFDHAKDPVGAHISRKQTAQFGYAERQVRADLELILPGILS